MKSTEAITVPAVCHLVEHGGAVVDEVRHRLYLKALGHYGHGGDTPYGTCSAQQGKAEILKKANRPTTSTTGH